MWWLVTTQNPLKKKEQFKNIDSRLSSTYLVNKNHKIKSQTLEFKLGTKFTYDTIKKLKTIMPKVNFYWIMGADNLYQMHNWHKWKEIFYLCPIIVVNRKGYFYKSLSSKASKYYWENRLDIKRLKNYKKLPVWSYLDIRPNPNSSTNFRKNIG